MTQPNPADKPKAATWKRPAVIIGGLLTLIYLANALTDWWYFATVLAGYGLIVSLLLWRSTYVGGFTGSDLIKLVVPAYVALKGEPQGDNATKQYLSEEATKQIGLVSTLVFGGLALILALAAPPFPVIAGIFMAFRAYAAGCFIHFWLSQPKEGLNKEKAKAIFGWPALVWRQLKAA